LHSFTTVLHSSIGIEGGQPVTAHSHELVS
jgi:hypothetical protein